MNPSPNVLERASTFDSALLKTPERGRVAVRTRYPSHLSRELDAEGKPRPLLHRRGTSQTYETLEDLLKEAGYKETRIFTPEVERREAERDEDGQQKARGDARGVGGAVVKLFSSWLPAKKTDVDREGEEGTNLGRSCPSSPLAHRSKRPSSNASTLRIGSPLESSSSSVLTIRPSGSNHYQRPSLSQLQHQHSLTRQQSSSSRSGFATSSTSVSSPHSHPHSRARMALRHAASVPHIDKRRGRAQPRTSRKPPPLPPTWLETLSAALLSPRLPSQPASPTNAEPRKPSIVSQRAHASPVGVTITNVVCHSTPSSRSPSAVRKPCVLLPSLAQTSVCEELIPAPPHSPHHLPHETPVPIDDDEDDELNLTMMLIPSKRQHSIRSLRSVLQHHNSLPTAVVHEEYARVMCRRIDVDENRQVEGDGHWDSGEFLTARIKRRRSGLPRNWGWTS